MKNSIRLVAVLAACCLFFTSCHDRILRGEGTKTSKSLDVASFSALEVDLNAITTVSVQPGAHPSVEVFGYTNHLEHLVPKMEGSRLVIEDDLKRGWTFGNRKEIEIRVIVSSLEELSLNGSSEGFVHGNVTGKTLSLDLSGAGKITVDSMNVSELKADISGAADIFINGGTATTASYEISGAGKIKAFALKTSETTTSISGAAKAEVSASDRLSVDISGAGKVSYKGHPTISKDVSGAGSIIDAN